MEIFQVMKSKSSKASLTPLVILELSSNIRWVGSHHEEYILWYFFGKQFSRFHHVLSAFRAFTAIQTWNGAFSSNIHTTVHTSNWITWTIWRGWADWVWQGYRGWRGWRGWQQWEYLEEEKLVREKKYKHSWTEEQRTKNKERYGYLADASWKAEMNNTTNNCIFQSHMP